MLAVLEQRKAPALECVVRNIFFLMTNRPRIGTLANISHENLELAFQAYDTP